MAVGKAIADLTLTGFFYLLHPGEHTSTRKTTITFAYKTSPSNLLKGLTMQQQSLRHSTMPAPSYTWNSLTRRMAKRAKVLHMVTPKSWSCPHSRLSHAKCGTSDSTMHLPTPLSSLSTYYHKAPAVSTPKASPMCCGRAANSSVDHSEYHQKTSAPMPCMLEAPWHCYEPRSIQSSYGFMAIGSHGQCYNIPIAQRPTPLTMPPRCSLVAPLLFPGMLHCQMMLQRPSRPLPHHKFSHLLTITPFPPSHLWPKSCQSSRWPRYNTNWIGGILAQNPIEPKIAHYISTSRISTYLLHT